MAPGGVPVDHNPYGLLRPYLGLIWAGQTAANGDECLAFPALTSPRQFEVRGVPTDLSFQMDIGVRLLAAALPRRGFTPQEALRQG